MELENLEFEEEGGVKPAVETPFSVDESVGQGMQIPETEIYCTAEDEYAELCSPTAEYLGNRPSDEVSSFAFICNSEEGNGSDFDSNAGNDESSDEEKENSTSASNGKIPQDEINSVVEDQQVFGLAAIEGRDTGTSGDNMENEELQPISSDEYSICEVIPTDTNDHVTAARNERDDQDGGHSGSVEESVTCLRDSESSASSDDDLSENLLVTTKQEKVSETIPFGGDGIEDSGIDKITESSDNCFLGGGDDEAQDMRQESMDEISSFENHNDERSLNLLPLDDNNSSLKGSDDSESGEDVSEIDEIGISSSYVAEIGDLEKSPSDFHVETLTNEEEERLPVVKNVETASCSLPYTDDYANNAVASSESEDEPTAYCAEKTTLGEEIASYGTVADMCQDEETCHESTSDDGHAGAIKIQFIDKSGPSAVTEEVTMMDSSADDLVQKKSEESVPSFEDPFSFTQSTTIENCTSNKPHLADESEHNGTTKDNLALFEAQSSHNDNSATGDDVFDFFSTAVSNGSHSCTGSSDVEHESPTCQRRREEAESEQCTDILISFSPQKEHRSSKNSSPLYASTVEQPAFDIFSSPPKQITTELEHHDTSSLEPLSSPVPSKTLLPLETKQFSLTNEEGPVPDATSPLSTTEEKNHHDTDDVDRIGSEIDSHSDNLSGDGSCSESELKDTDDQILINTIEEQCSPAEGIQGAQFEDGYTKEHTSDTQNTSSAAESEAIGSTVEKDVLEASSDEWDDFVDFSEVPCTETTDANVESQPCEEDLQQGENCFESGEDCFDDDDFGDFEHFSSAPSQPEASQDLMADPTPTEIPQQTNAYERLECTEFFDSFVKDVFSNTLQGETLVVRPRCSESVDSLVKFQATLRNLNEKMDRVPSLLSTVCLEVEEMTEFTTPKSSVSDLSIDEFMHLRKSEMEFVRSCLSKKLYKAKREHLVTERSDEYNAYLSLLNKKCQTSSLTAIDSYMAEMLNSLEVLQQKIFKSELTKDMMKVAQEAALSAEAVLSMQAAAGSSRPFPLLSFPFSSSIPSALKSRENSISSTLADKSDCDMHTMRILTPTNSSSSIKTSNTSNGQASASSLPSGASTNPNGNSSDRDSISSGSGYDSDYTSDNGENSHSVLSGPGSITSSSSRSGNFMKRFSKLTSSFNPSSRTLKKEYIIKLRKNTVNSDITQMELKLDEINGGFDEIKYQCAAAMYSQDELLLVAPSKIKIYSYPSGKLLSQKNEKSMVYSFVKPNQIWTIDINTSE